MPWNVTVFWGEKKVFKRDDQVQTRSFGQRQEEERTVKWAVEGTAEGGDWLEQSSVEGIRGELGELAGR